MPELLAKNKVLGSNCWGPYVKWALPVTVHNWDESELVYIRRRYRPQGSFPPLRSELTFLTPPQCPLTFWWRSFQGQGKDQLGDLSWPYDKFMCCLYICRFLDVLNTNLLFIWDTVASLLRLCKQQRAPENVSGRPAATEAARRTWPGCLPGVMQQQEPYESKQLYIKILSIDQQT